jgi:hypothetical protein
MTLHAQSRRRGKKRLDRPPPSPPSDPSSTSRKLFIVACGGATKHGEKQRQLAVGAKPADAYRSVMMTKFGKLDLYEGDRKSRSVAYPVKTDLQGDTIAEMREAYGRVFQEQAEADQRRRSGRIPPLRR